MGIYKPKKELNDQKVLLKKLKNLSIATSSFSDDSIQTFSPKRSIIKKPNLTLGTALHIDKIKNLEKNIPSSPNSADTNSDYSLEKKAEAKEHTISFADQLTLERNKIIDEIEDYKVAAKKNAEIEAKEKAMKAIEKEMIQYKKEKMANIDNEKKAVLEKAKNEGYEHGKEKALAELKVHGENLLKAINGLELEKQKIIGEFKPELLELSIKIAEKILQSELSQNEQAINNVIDEAIRKITDKDRVIIRVNAKDAEIVRSHRNVILDQMSDIKN